MATQAEVARHLGISQPAVTKLVQAGVFTQSGRGSLDLDRCRVAYLSRLRDEAAGRASQADADGDELDIVAERARLAKEQADRLAMENHVRRGELVPFEQFVAPFSTVLGTLRSRLLAVPAECALRFAAAKTAAMAEALLRDVIHEALHDLSAGMTRIGTEVGARGDDLAALRGEATAKGKSHDGTQRSGRGRSNSASGPRRGRGTGRED